MGAYLLALLYVPFGHEITRGEAFRGGQAQPAFSITNAIASTLVCSGMAIATRRYMAHACPVHPYMWAFMPIYLLINGIHAL